MTPLGHGTPVDVAGGVNLVPSVTCNVGEFLLLKVAMLDIGAGTGTIATPSGWALADGGHAGVADGGGTVTLHARLFKKTAASTSESATVNPPSGGTTNCYGHAIITRYDAGSTYDSAAQAGSVNQLANGAASGITTFSATNTGTLASSDSCAETVLVTDSGTGLNPAGLNTTSGFTLIDDWQDTGPNIGWWNGYKAITGTSAVASAFSMNADSSMGAAQAITVIISAPAAGSPNITGTSSTSPQKGSTLTITGTGFGAAQGTQVVKIGGVVQAVQSWSATSIVVTVDEGTNKFGVTLNVEIWDTTLTSNSFALTSLLPEAGWSYVDIVTPDLVYGLQTTPALASTDQIAYETPGAVDSSGVPAPLASVTSFRWRVWSSTGGGWGTIWQMNLTTTTKGSYDPDLLLKGWF